MKTNAPQPPTSIPKTAFLAARRALRHDDEGAALARRFLTAQGGIVRKLTSETEAYSLSFPTLFDGKDCTVETVVRRPYDDAEGRLNVLVVAAYRIGRTYRLGILRTIDGEDGAWFETPEGERVFHAKDGYDWKILGYVVAVSQWNDEGRLKRATISPDGVRIDDRGVPFFRDREEAKVAA